MVVDEDEVEGRWKEDRESLISVLADQLVLVVKELGMKSTSQRLVERLRLLRSSAEAWRGRREEGAKREWAMMGLS